MPAGMPEPGGGGWAQPTPPAGPAAPAGPLRRSRSAAAPGLRHSGGSRGRALHRAGLTWLLLSGGLLRPASRLLVPLGRFCLAMAGSLFRDGAAA